LRTRGRGRSELCGLSKEDGPGDPGSPRDTRRRITSTSVDVCEGCGLHVAGGTAGCQGMFDEFRAREMSELAPTYASTRLTIADFASAVDTDTYVAALDSWARSTWAAYSALLEIAGRWIDAAVA